MSLGDAATIYAKELRETLRDRRTLLVMILLPLVLYPLLAIGIGEWLASQKTEMAERPSRIVLLAAERALLLRQALLGDPNQFLLLPRVPGAAAASATTAPPATAPPTTAPAATAPPASAPATSATDGTAVAALHAGAVDVLVEPAPDFAAKLRQGGTAVVSVRYDQSREDSTQALERLSTLVDRLGQKELEQRLRARALPRDFAQPLSVVKQDVAPRGRATRRQLSEVVPMLVVLMVILGAFYPAIDLTAGERERGTLETLLTSPVARIDLIIGKFLAVATVAMFTGVLNLLSLSATAAYFIKMAEPLGLQIPWHAAGLTALSLVPAALFFSAVMLAVAALARSFKEAQNLLTPVYLVCAVPAVLAGLPGMRLTGFSALVPGVNIALLVRELIAGDARLGPALLCAATTFVYGLGALAAAARIYESERLLFAPEGIPWRRLRGLAAIAAAPRQQQFGAGEALSILAVSFILSLYVAQPLVRSNFAIGTLLLEWGAMLLPPLLWVRRRRLALGPALGLRAPSRWPFFAAALLTGLSAWHCLSTLAEWVLPLPRQFLEEMMHAFIDTRRPLWLSLLLLAVSPAVCEEVLYRGALLFGLRRRLGDRGALLVSAILFGIMHGSLYRFLPTFVLGLLLAQLALASGSILPGMLLHLLNNGIVLVLASVLPRELVVSTAAASGAWWQLPLFGLSATVMVLGIGLCEWLRRRGAAGGS